MLFNSDDRISVYLYSLAHWQHSRVGDWSGVESLDGGKRTKPEGRVENGNKNKIEGERDWRRNKRAVRQDSKGTKTCCYL